jgi:hypothetical protein
MLTTDMLNNPVMAPSSDAWETQGITSPDVMPFEGGYKMWYTGWTVNWTYSNIGYATSPDGFTWTRDTLSNPVLRRESAGRWDDGNLSESSVLLIDGVYHMLYTGTRPSEGQPWNIGWATSADGIHWNKYNNPATTSESYLDSDPVLEPDNGQWDGTWITMGTVMVEDDSLRMWYNGSRSPGAQNLWRIGHATAPNQGLTGVFENGEMAFPNLYYLMQNYPNPFNPSTTIEFDLPKASEVRIEVYNIAGQKIQTLLNTKMSAGSHQVEFNAQNLSSGVYFYRIESGEFQDVKKMILIK